MEIANVIELLETARKTLEALKVDRADAANYLKLLDAETKRTEEMVKALEIKAVGCWRGRSSWTHEQVMNARRGIRSCTGKWMTMSEVCEALPQIDRALIEREMEWMVERNGIKWNGGRGLASKYVRA